MKTNYRVMAVSGWFWEVLPCARRTRSASVPLIPGFTNTLGSAHGGDSILQHSPGAGIQHVETASQDPSPLPAKAPQSLGCFWDQKSGALGLGSSHSCSVKKGSMPRNGNPEVPVFSNLGATRVVFHFPLCNLLVPQISINLKSRPLPNA